jgi:hypothetical protein
VAFGGKYILQGGKLANTESRKMVGRKMAMKGPFSDRKM